MYNLLNNNDVQLVVLGCGEYEYEQFFVELALVAVIGFTLAVGSGTLIAGHVGEEVLNYQVEFSGLSEEVEDDYNYISNWDENYFTEVSLDDMVEAIGISPCKLCTYCWNGKE